MDRSLMECEECGSQYVATALSMTLLCPECSHVLYGTPKCSHKFISGHCIICGWDGSR